MSFGPPHPLAKFVVFLDTFYENPKATHAVGRNVSKTKLAKLLVFSVKDENAPLVLPPARR